MSEWSNLHALRIGCVQYLNSKPLVAAYDGDVWFAHPSELTARMEAGELDAALIPIFDSLRHPEYRLVDGVAISARGPVYSVFLAWQGPLARVRRVALDPASRTSAHLVQVILAEFYGMEPEFVPAAAIGDDTARLLIGNQAIAFRQQHRSEFHYMDLAGEWHLQTALPMVFATWAVRPEAATRATGNAFRALLAAGRAQLGFITAAEPDPDFALKYLTSFVRFDLGPEEKAGIAKFAQLLNKHIQPTRFENAFV